MKKFVKLALVTLIPVMILIIAILVHAQVTSREKFSLVRYALVNVTGFNGRATAVTGVNEVGLYAALAGKDATDAEKQKYKNFVDSISISLDHTDHISNGDELIVTVSYSEKYAEQLGINIPVTQRTHTVTGLEDGTGIDLFCDLEIVTSGVSPFITAYYKNKSQNEFVATLSYSLNKTTDLAIGDTIEISCEVDESAAASYGYYYDCKTSVYTIEIADYYLTKNEEMPTEVLQEILAEDIDAIQRATNDTTTHMSYQVTNKEEYLFRDNNEEAVDFEYYGSILAKNTTTMKLEHQNYILVLLKGRIRMPNYQDVPDPYDYEDAYFCFIYNDAIITTDGKFTMATNDAIERYVCGHSYEDCFREARAKIGAGYSFGELVNLLSDR